MNKDQVTPQEDDGEDVDLGETEVAPEIEEALFLTECAKAAEAGL